MIPNNPAPRVTEMLRKAALRAPGSALERAALTLNVNHAVLDWFGNQCRSEANKGLLSEVVLPPAA